MDINGAVALVTGGASGLGRATAETLLAAGAKVVVLDLPGSPGEAVAKELGDAVRFVPGDVRSADDVTTALDTAAGLGTLRVAVNCAGTGDAYKTVGKNGAYPLDKFTRIIEINLIGTFNVIRLAAERMAATDPVDGERGVIVNTASVAAFDGQIGQTPYSASKGGVVGMTLPMARDLARHGIRVNTIAPGLIDTPIYGTGEQAEAFKAQLGQSVVYPNRLGSAEEYASMAVEILTNDYMNGETVRLDGAIRMPPK